MSLLLVFLITGRPFLTMLYASLLRRFQPPSAEILSVMTLGNYTNLPADGGYALKPLWNSPLLGVSTASVIIYDLWSNGSFPLLSAFGVLMFTLLIVLGDASQSPLPWIQDFIRHSPFCVMATSNGNNLFHGYGNIETNPKVGLIFFIPGYGPFALTSCWF